MATHTVYGCYKASDGSIEFDDTETDCTDATITGCLETSGANAGKITITHDYFGCSTQYYACYDKTTGKFKFEADDGCCVELIEDAGNCCGFSCSSRPRYFSITFSGITNCGSDDTGPPPCNSRTCTEFNQTYVVEDTGSDCEYEYIAGVVFVKLYISGQGGMGNPCINNAFCIGAKIGAPLCFWHSSSPDETDNCDRCLDIPASLANIHRCRDPNPAWDDLQCNGENGSAAVSPS